LLSQGIENHVVVSSNIETSRRSKSDEEITDSWNLLFSSAVIIDRWRSGEVLLSKKEELVVQSKRDRYVVCAHVANIFVEVCDIAYQK
jgi:hypothetical protein